MLGPVTLPVWLGVTPSLARSMPRPILLKMLLPRIALPVLLPLIA